MKRNEHLQWAKDRALKEDGMNAWLSFVSDMLKHEKLSNHIALELGNTFFIGGVKPLSEVHAFIKGFN